MAPCFCNPCITPYCGGSCCNNCGWCAPETGAYCEPCFCPCNPQMCPQASNMANFGVCGNAGTPSSSIQLSNACPSPLPLAVAAAGRSSGCILGNLSNLGTTLSGLTKAASGVVGVVKKAQTPVNSVSSNSLLIIGAVAVGLVVIFMVGNK
jgi:hypothetical protein